MITQIKCVDNTIISLSNIESIKLIPKMDFLSNTKNGIIFHRKGEKFFKPHFWNKKRSFAYNSYTWIDCYYKMTYSAEAVVETMKEDLYLNFIPWRHFFIDKIAKYQIEYNKKKDCVTRKTTMVIRTKSGQTLYATCNCDMAANSIIEHFNNTFQ